MQTVRRAHSRRRSLWDAMAAGAECAVQWAGTCATLIDDDRILSTIKLIWANYIEKLGVGGWFGRSRMCAHGREIGISAANWWRWRPTERQTATTAHESILLR